MRHMTPDIKIEFEYQIRKAYLTVEASAWSDEDGIYKTELNDVYMDGMSVVSLLTDDDLSEIDDAIEPAIHAEASDNACTAFNPARDAHRLGD